MDIEKKGNIREVRYDEKQWRLLKIKREKGLKLMKALYACGITCTAIHGSVARGDVDEDSDVDVALLCVYPPSLVEICLERSGYRIHNLVLVQPTPIHTPKIYIVLDPEEEQVVTVPLVELRPIEIEFYRFSGMLTLKELEEGKRVPGVNKRLVLVDPTPWGHIEIPVLGNEGFVAKKLGISIEVVMDRVYALTRRAEEGHTGLFIELDIPPGINVEEVIERLCSENKLFRQRVSRYGLCI